MNQKERDKFPKIYELMDKLAGYDCDKQTWDELNELLNSLVSRESLKREQYIGDLSLKEIDDLFRVELLKNMATPFRELVSMFDPDSSYGDYLKQRRDDYFKNNLVNYTKPLEKPLKRSLIVVLGVLGVMYHNNVSYKAIDFMWNEWLEYKRNEKE